MMPSSMNQGGSVGFLVSFHRTCFSRWLGPVFCAVVTLCDGWTQAAEMVSLPDPLPDRIEHIEVVSVEGQPPMVMLHQRAPAPEPTRQVVGQSDDLLSLGHAVAADGPCTATKGADRGGIGLRLNFSGPELCRVGVALGKEHRVLDLLSGESLRLRLEGAEPRSLVLEDRHGRHAYVELERARSDGDTLVDLRAFAKDIDLRDVVSMTVGVSAEGQGARLAAVQLGAAALATVPRSRTGFWAWEYREVIDDPGQAVQTCRTHGCQRLLVQMPSDADSDELWSGYAAALRWIDAQGIEAYALDGYPEAAYEPARLAAKIERVLSLMSGGALAGVQLDIEPYILPRFASDPDGFPRYLEAVRMMKSVTQGRTRLSIVMPFWFSSIEARGRAVGFEVMDVADEVAIMSYRTDLDELQAIATDVLRYGDLVGRPVWLAVETRALPLERHVRLQRVDVQRMANAFVDRRRRQLVYDAPPRDATGDWFRVVERTMVRPERLTFSGRTQASVQSAVEAVMRALRHRSLAGVLIHDLTGFRMLPAESQ